jgi:hypothetical protein
MTRSLPVKQSEAGSERREGKGDDLMLFSERVTQPLHVLDLLAMGPLDARELSLELTA